MNLLTNCKRRNKLEFFSIIDDIISNKTVQEMRLYRQHGTTSCYEHCLHVAYYSYIIAKKFSLDYKATARAAMLHDLFLYDWRASHPVVKFSDLHAFAHPKIALKNASQLFELNNVEQDIIVKHMWPVTLSLPKYAESYVVTFMDKYSAMRETYLYYRRQLKRNRIYKYTYIFLSLLIFRIV